jgi:hypothetical protein
MKRLWTLVPLSQPTPAHETPMEEWVRTQYDTMTPAAQRIFWKLMERADAWAHEKNER